MLPGILLAEDVVVVVEDDGWSAATPFGVGVAVDEAVEVWGCVPASIWAVVTATTLVGARLIEEEAGTPEETPRATLMSEAERCTVEVAATEVASTTGAGGGCVPTVPSELRGKPSAPTGGCPSTSVTPRSDSTTGSTELALAFVCADLGVKPCPKGWDKLKDGLPLPVEGSGVGDW